VLYDTIAASFINNRRGTGDEKLVWDGRSADLSFSTLSCVVRRVGVICKIYGTVFHSIKT
jgi:hypothetical protein